MVTRPPVSLVTILFIRRFMVIVIFNVALKKHDDYDNSHSMRYETRDFLKFHETSQIVDQTVVDNRH